MRLKTLALIMVAAMVMAMFAGCNMYGNNDSSSSHPDSSSSRPSSSLPSTSSTPSVSGEPSSEPGSSLPDDISSSVRATLSTDFSEIGALDTSPVTWGPGVRKNAAGRSEACDLLQEAYADYDALFIEPDEKIVYLTFDQGYENGYTEAILDVLKEKGVKGVFFLTGHYINSQPSIVQRMIDEGHVLGNHSYDHPNFATAKPEDAFADMSKLHEAVYDNWGVSMELFRFPEGAFSEQSLGLVQSTGYTSVFWSFAYKDWDPQNQMEPAVALQKVMEGAHNGCIFLFHTVGETNSLILGDVIDNLRAEGYDFGLVRPVGGQPGTSTSHSTTGTTSDAPTDTPDAPLDAPSDTAEPEKKDNIFLRPWP